MDLNRITEEEMWDWVDDGTAESHLHRMRNDPDIPGDDADLLEEIIDLHGKIQQLPLFSAPQGFDKAVLARVKNSHPEPFILPTWLKFGFPGLIFTCIIFISFAGLETMGSISFSDYLHFAMPAIPSFDLTPFILLAPMIILFWALDRFFSTVQ